MERGTGGSRVRNLPEKIAALQKRRERYKSMLAELERTGERQISLADPDSRAMTAHTRVAVGYSVQIVVDAKPLCFRQLWQWHHATPIGAHRATPAVDLSAHLSIPPHRDGCISIRPLPRSADRQPSTPESPPQTVGL